MPIEIQQDTAPAWHCPVCGRENIEQASFCGNCGLSRPEPGIEEANWEKEFFRASSIRPFRRPFLRGSAREGDRSASEGNHSGGSKIRATKGSASPHSENRKASVFFALKPFLESKPAATLLILALFVGLSPILALQPLGKKAAVGKASEKLIWLDLRTHLSRNLGLTLAEVDNIAFAAFRRIPEGEEPIEAGQAKAMRAFLKNLDLKEKPIFRWLPTQGPVLTTHLNRKEDSDETPIFADLPTDHPVYKVWKPLFRWKLPLQAGNSGKISYLDGFSSGCNGYHEILEAKPFSNLQWKDWKRVLESLLGVEAVEEFSRKSGDAIVSHGEFARTLPILSRPLGFQLPSHQAPNLDRPISRFEAFAVLAKSLEMRESLTE